MIQRPLGGGASVLLPLLSFGLWQAQAKKFRFGQINATTPVLYEVQDKQTTEYTLAIKGNGN
ncbi:hypothetical protein B9J78_01765 [bacterium Unc6]|nr:hypothetical protein [bacterium Unc6]